MTPSAKFVPLLFRSLVTSCPPVAKREFFSATAKKTNVPPGPTFIQAKSFASYVKKQTTPLKETEIQHYSNLLFVHWRENALSVDRIEDAIDNFPISDGILETFKKQDYYNILTRARDSYNKYFETMDGDKNYLYLNRINGYYLEARTAWAEARNITFGCDMVGG